MKIFLYIVATVLIIAGIVLLCFSHEGFRYHVHETLVGLGPFELLGSDGDATASFSHVYGMVSLGIGIGIGLVMLLIAMLKRRW